MCSPAIGSRSKHSSNQSMKFASALWCNIALSVPDLVWYDAVSRTCTLVDFSFSPGALGICLEFVATGGEFGDSLFGEKLLECPFLNVLCLVLLELGYERNGALKNRTLVLFAAGNDLGKLVDAFIDSFSATSFDLRRSLAWSRFESSSKHTFFVVVPPDTVPFI